MLESNIALSYILAHIIFKEFEANFANGSLFVIAVLGVFYRAVFYDICPISN